VTLTGSDGSDGIAGTALDEYVQLIRVEGDASVVGRELRSHAARAVESGRITLIVDLSAATWIGEPLAWELSRAHERLLWRGGQMVVVLGSEELDPLFAAFGLYRSPEVVPTMAQALSVAYVSEAGVARSRDYLRDPSGVPPAPAELAAPQFAWRRHEEVPTTWSFTVPGGDTAPGVARAAVRRVLTGRLGAGPEADAVLLVSEAVTNSVLHGGADGSETVALTLALLGDHVHVEVTDPVGGFEPPSYRDDVYETGGRGLQVIHSIARTWGVGAPPEGRLWFDLPRTAA
jgi:anti-sigma regulatory factor (Ser/Thr protein kinase)